MRNRELQFPDKKKGAHNARGANTGGGDANFGAKERLFLKNYVRFFPVQRLVYVPRKDYLAFTNRSLEKNG